MESSTVESLIAEVRNQWKRMWRERIDDRVRAEGIAAEDFDMLFVDRGTVVLATRNFKLLTLREILESHKVENAERFVPRDPHVGGWGRFVRTYIAGHRHTRARLERKSIEEEKKVQQLKKGGRGWLHV